MRDRFPLGVLAALLLAVACAWLLSASATRGQFAEPLSTYRSSADGSRALWLLAEAQGLPVRRRHLDLLQIDPQVRGLVLMGVDALGEKETEKLLEFVSAGGRLLLVARARDEAKARESSWLQSMLEGRRPLLSAFDVELKACESPEIERELLPALASPLSRGAESLQARVSGYLGRTNAQTFLPLIVDPHHEGDAVAITFAHGAGRVTVVASPDLASNRALGRADNPVFWTSLLSAFAGDGVAEIDEFHHGFRNERSFSAYAARYGMHWAMLQLLLAVWLWIAANRHFGTPRAVAREERVGSADYLLAMARIYRLGGHRSHAARLLVDGLRRALASRAGVCARAPVEAVCAALARRGRRDLARSLQAADRSIEDAAASDGALLALGRRCASAYRLAHADARRDALGPFDPRPATAGALPSRLHRSKR